MDKKRWKKLSHIFDLALTLPKERRTTYIQNLCAGDLELQQEVDSLLASIEESDKMLDDHLQKNRVLLNNLTSHLEQDIPSTLLTDTTIGHWCVLDLLGRGGMGEVYEVERSDSDIHQKGALKIMRRGFNTPENMRRFRLEKQILAGLNHPNIASLIDGGISDDGLPYLVMEFVDGVPIDQYCDQHQLSIDKRLSLFKAVCQAVQHAHQNLIIHRDLKPENILVAEEGHVKILDFGIAKLLDSDLYDLPVAETRQSMRLMSLEYAAPEQVSGDPITTATDVYSLGVLLYELLAGVHPFTLEEERVRAIEQTILNKEPSVPSRRLAEIEHPATVAKARNTDPETLLSILIGDLDAIVNKALRKETGQRYESVAQFVDDLDRYKTDKPVDARYGSARYRISKFFKRHKKGLSATAIFILILVSTIGYYTFRLTEERNTVRFEAKKAKQVTNFLINLFEANDPNQSKGEEITARALLDKGGQNIKSMKDQPEIQAAMLRVMGDIYKKLGSYEKSKSYYQQALVIKKEKSGQYDPEVASVMNGLGTLFLETEEISKAKSLFQSAYDIYDSNRTENSEEHIVSTLLSLGRAFLWEGKYDIALSYYNQAMESSQQLKGVIKDQKQADIFENIGFALEHQKHLKEAEYYYRNSLMLRNKLWDGEHLSLATSYNDLGRILWSTGKLDSAEYYHRKALAIRTNLLGYNHQLVAQSYNNIAAALEQKQDYSQAKNYYRRALAIYKNVFDSNSRFIGMSTNNLGHVYLMEGKYDTALYYLEEAYNIYKQVLHPQHIWRIKNMQARAKIHRIKQNFSKANHLYQRALKLRTEAFPDKKPNIAQIKL